MRDILFAARLRQVGGDQHNYAASGVSQTVRYLSRESRRGQRGPIDSGYVAGIVGRHQPVYLYTVNLSSEREY